MSKFDLAVAIAGSILGALAALSAILLAVIAIGLRSGALTIQ